MREVEVKLYSTITEEIRGIAALYIYRWE